MIVVVVTSVVVVGVAVEVIEVLLVEDQVVVLVSECISVSLYLSVPTETE